MTGPQIKHHAALDAVAGDYGRMVSSICRKMIWDEDAARDAAQQVWIEIVKSYPTFRGESKISTWIYTITRRVALEYAKNERTISTRFLRAYSLKDEFDLPGNVDLDKDLWIKQMCDKCITGILHCADSEVRLAHIFRHIAGLEYEEIAAVLGKDEAAVRQMISRTMKKLNAFLNEKCTLYNPEGNCRCRMKTLVEAIDLPQEYEKLRRIVGKVSFFRQSELVFPGKNYWEALL